LQALFERRIVFRVEMAFTELEPCDFDCSIRSFQIDVGLQLLGLEHDRPNQAHQGVLHPCKDLVLSLGSATSKIQLEALVRHICTR
jgi:hypothetical protein